MEMSPALPRVKMRESYCCEKFYHLVFGHNLNSSQRQYRAPLMLIFIADLTHDFAPKRMPILVNTCVRGPVNLCGKYVTIKFLGWAWGTAVR